MARHERVLIFSLLLICLSGYFNLLRANGTPRIINFTPEQYKGQYQNWMLSAAPDGRLFSANSGGMLYYDGLQWFLHPLPNKQVVRSILYQSPDRVYTGAYGEFGYWSINAAHQWDFTSLSNLIRDSIFQEEEIWHITRQDSVIWFQSFSRIYRYDGKKVQSFQPPGSIMFAEPFEDRLLVPVIGKGLYQLDKQGRFSLFPQGEIFAGDRIVGISSVKGELWVSTQQRGVFIHKENRWQSWNSRANEEIRNHTLNRVLYTRSDQLIFATIGSGVLITDREGSYSNWLSKQDGLQNNTVLSLCESASGHIWMGLDEGIDAILYTPGVHFQVEKAGMLGTCYAFAQYHGRLYVGSNQGLFFAELANLKKPGKLHFSRVEGVSGQVWYISSQRDQLVVGHNDGTGVLEGNRLRPISGISGGWSLVNPPERSGYLLEGTYTGISRYVFERDSWVWKDQLLGFKQPVKKLIPDRLGNLWALHPNKGLYWIKCDADWEKAIEIREIGSLNKLPHLFEMDIMMIDSRIIVRSGHNYYEANPETGDLSALGSLRGVDLANLDQILIGADKRGLWISGDGVLLWTSARQEYSWPVALIDRYESLQQLDDHFLAGVHNGFVILELEAPTIGGQAIGSPLLAISALNSPEARLIIPSQSTAFELPAGINSIRLWFGRDLVDRAQKLWYRIGGGDWQAIEGYTLDLPDQRFGDLQLEWKLGLNGVPRQFEIRLVPRWYQGNLARVLYVLIGISGLILFTQFLKRRFRQQQKALEWENQRLLNEQQIETQNTLLQADLAAKSRELAFSSQALMHKNAILTDILEEVHAIKAELGSRMPEKHYRRLENLIQDNIESEHDRNVFELNFAEVHMDWLARLREKFPDLTPGDLRLAAYLKMNLSSKEIAPLLGISIRGVENKRYRLRHKMGIPAEENLIHYLMSQ